MKVIKKIIKYISLILLLLIIGSSIYLYQSGPILLENTDAIIEEVIAKPLPALVKGQTGIVNANGTNIWYESIVPTKTSKGAVLLIMGISNDALGWPKKFIQSFVDSGYQVIRYDHRGTGLSDWMDNFDKSDPYTLADMAFDGVAVLNELHIDKSHIIGVSMGGMIAQELAIKHPDKVLSLTSIMSSGNIFDKDLPPISSTVAYDLIKVAIKYSLIPSQKNKVKLHLASRIILTGEGTQSLNLKEIAEQVLYNHQKRKGYNRQVSEQHQAAVFTSGSRYEQLKVLEIPSLIIHGKKDPFIPIAHGKKCAQLIPNADSLWMDNMGHDIPNEFIPLLSKKIVGNFNRLFEKGN